MPSDSPVTGSGPKAPCGFRGRSAAERLAACITGLRFEANALVGGKDGWPKGNFFPRETEDVKFAKHSEGSGGDYHLLVDSPHKSAGRDGKDLGADVDAIEMATRGVK